MQVMKVFDNGDSDVQAWEVNEATADIVKALPAMRREPDLKALVPGEHVAELMENAMDKSVILSGD